MTDSYVVLEPTQTLAERPFTDAAHSAQDVHWLSRMVDCLRHVLADLPDDATAAGPYVLRHTEPDGRWCRTVVCQAAALKGQQDLAAVGFFGQRQEVPRELVEEITRLDEEFLDEFLQHPLIVAYCTQQLPDGNFGNLVLMSHLEAKKQWEASERHRYAAFKLAPQYYATVRLHNLEFPGGVNGPQIMLLRTKYYAYGPKLWRGVREQTPPVKFAFG